MSQKMKEKMKYKNKNNLQSDLVAMFQGAKKFNIFLCNSIFFKCVRPSECFFRAPIPVMQKKLKGPSPHNNNIGVNYCL